MFSVHFSRLAGQRRPEMREPALEGQGFPRVFAFLLMPDQGRQLNRQSRPRWSLLASKTEAYRSPELRRIHRMHVGVAICDTIVMSQAVCPLVSAEDRVRLEAIIADRKRTQKHVARAVIILHSSDRLNVAEIAKHSCVSRPAVWRWQRRFVEAGVNGLLREGSRKPGKPPMFNA